MLNKDDLKEQQDFWNDFAKEYAAIQEESPFPIAKDVSQYLLEKNILPTSQFVDLAGGVGRFVPFIAPFCSNYLLIDFSKEMLQIGKGKYPLKNVTYLLKDQERFLKEGKTETSSILFSAMNPNFKEESSFHDFLAFSAKKHLILRMTKEEDTLFSPYEDEEKILFWEKEYLKKWHIPFKEILFSYEASEIISKDFFQSYFESQLPKATLEKIISFLFKEKKTTLNARQVVFSLLIFDGLLS